VPFHLIARLQPGTEHFAGMESTVVRLIVQAASKAGGQLLAYAVMPNHLHLVYAQGVRPLSAFMQPLLRRLALRVQRRTSTSGHVFERRFRSYSCNDPDYLRNAIAYVHLNPVRARLCRQVDGYEWTSHRQFLSEEVPERASGLLLFARDGLTPPSAVRDNYLAFMAWRIEMDEHIRFAGPGSDFPAPRPPLTTAGDGYWLEQFGWSALERLRKSVPTPPAVDLRDLALRFLRSVAPDMSLELLCSGKKTRPLCHVRGRLIRHAKENGHRNCAIARFLNISDPIISRY
jgi:REP element-mobilizing transposase RayT